MKIHCLINTQTLTISNLWQKASREFDNAEYASGTSFFSRRIETCWISFLKSWRRKYIEQRGALWSAKSNASRKPQELDIRGIHNFGSGVVQSFHILHQASIIVHIGDWSILDLPWRVYSVKPNIAIQASVCNEIIPR